MNSREESLLDVIGMLADSLREAKGKLQHQEETIAMLSSENDGADQRLYKTFRTYVLRRVPTMFAERHCPNYDGGNFTLGDVQRVLDTMAADWQAKRRALQKIRDADGEDYSIEYAQELAREQLRDE